MLSCVLYGSSQVGMDAGLYIFHPCFFNIFRYYFYTSYIFVKYIYIFYTIYSFEALNLTKHCMHKYSLVCNFV